MTAGDADIEAESIAWDDAERPKRIARFRIVEAHYPELEMLTSLEGSMLHEDFRNSFVMGLFAATIVLGVSIIEEILQLFFHKIGIKHRGVGRMLTEIERSDTPFRHLLPRIRRANEFRIGIVHGRPYFDFRGIASELKEYQDLDALKQGVAQEILITACETIKTYLESKRVI